MQFPIVVNGRISIPESAVEVQAVRASGPGGQNVNKLSTRIRLWVDLDAIPALTPEERARVRHVLQWRLDARGRLQVSSQATRHQSRNAEEAAQQAAELIRMAIVPPKVRRRTRAPYGAKLQRLDEKRRHGARLRDRRVEPD